MISWETSYLKHCSIKFKSLVDIESGNYKERKNWEGGGTRVQIQKVETSSQNIL